MTFVNKLGFFIFLSNYLDILVTGWSPVKIYPDDWGSTIQGWQWKRFSKGTLVRNLHSFLLSAIIYGVTSRVRRQSYSS